MVTGLLGWVLGATTSIRWMLFGISCLAQVLMFGLVGVMFYENDILMKASGFNKERRMYQAIILIFLVCWSTYAIIWAQTYEGGNRSGVYGEDYAAAWHVVLTFFAKDVTQVLISWINACFTARLNDLKQKKGTEEETPMFVSHMNVINARMQRKTFFEKLEEENPTGLLSQAVLPAADYSGKHIFSTKKIPIAPNQAPRKRHTGNKV